MSKFCEHDDFQRACVFCLSDEVERCWRTINGIEKLLGRFHIWIQSPLSDSVLQIIEQREALHQIIEDTANQIEEEGMIDWANDIREEKRLLG